MTYKTHEAYWLLEDAGMPEIENLFIDPARHWGVTDVWVAPGREPIDAEISHQFARDIITMHAIRWWCTIGRSITIDKIEAQCTEGIVGAHKMYTDLVSRDEDVLNAICEAVKGTK